MARYAGKEVRVWAGARDLSGRSSAVTIGGVSEALDMTSFLSDGWREQLGGLKTWSMDQRGFYDDAAAQVDELFNSTLGGSAIVTVSHAGSIANAGVGYSGVALHTAHSPAAEVGALALTGATFSGSSTLDRVMVGLSALSRSTTHTGTAFYLGDAMTRGYAALHCMAGSGGTMDVVVSTASVAAPNSWSAWLTFTQLSGSGAEFKTAATSGCFVRVVATIAGAGPDFDYVVAVGPYQAKP